MERERTIPHRVCDLNNEITVAATQANTLDSITVQDTGYRVQWRQRSERASGLFTIVWFGLRLNSSLSLFDYFFIFLCLLFFIFF